MRVAYKVRVEDGNRLRISPHDYGRLASPSFPCNSMERIEAFSLLDEPDSFLLLP